MFSLLRSVSKTEPLALHAQKALWHWSLRKAFFPYYYYQYYYHYHHHCFDGILLTCPASVEFVYSAGLSWTCDSSASIFWVTEIARQHHQASFGQISWKDQGVLITSCLVTWATTSKKIFTHLRQEVD